MVEIMKRTQGGDYQASCLLKFKWAAIGALSALSVVSLLQSFMSTQRAPQPCGLDKAKTLDTAIDHHQATVSRCLIDQTRKQHLAARTHELLHSSEPEEQYYSDILAEIRAGCGELCTNDKKRRVKLDNIPDDTDLPFATYFSYRVVAKNVNCCDLFAHPLLDASAVRWPPPRQIPDVMRKDFLGFVDNGTEVILKGEFYTERFSGGEAATPSWSVKSIEKMKKQSMEGKLIGNYGGKGTAKLRAYAEKYCRGKHVAVVGSKSPWLESILLGIGARHVTTIEYGKITSLHPNVTTLTNAEFSEGFMNGSLEPFDAFISFSSMEHAGLGRYGDLLNPWGDIIMAAKMHCALKPGGIAIIGVPTLKDQGEGLVFNAHRQYGRARWPIFLTNYRPLPQLKLEGEEYYHQDIVAAEAV